MRTEPATLTPADLDALGERYGRLVLAMGRHDPDYVDAFYGPPQWKLEADRDSLPLPRILAVADSLARRLGARSPRGADELTELRQRFLRRQLEALAARARMLNGEKLSFDAESQALYDAVAPSLGDSSFLPALARPRSLLPGPARSVSAGSGTGRSSDSGAKLVTPCSNVAIREAQRRTREHLALPDSESFVVEFMKVTRGGDNCTRRLSQPDQVTWICRATSSRARLACHEGYPGTMYYHVFLLEKALCANVVAGVHRLSAHGTSGAIAEGPR